MIHHSSLNQLVLVSKTQGYCSSSPMSLEDSFPGKNGVIEDIVGIATVRRGEQVIGWLYRTASGKFYAQANRYMPLRDRLAAGTKVDVPINAPPRATFYSGISQITVLPWSDLTVKNCDAKEFTRTR